MKKVRMHLCVSALMAGLLISCAQNADEPERQMSEKKKTTMSELKKSLKAGLETGREDPFEGRSFEPYLSGQWIGNAVSYGCYREGQAPGVNGPDEEQILEDLRIVSQYWNLIRVYNSDDDTERILEVIRKNDLPIRMMLGIWLSNETDHPEKIDENVANVACGIELANRFDDIVIAVNVGNETQVFWSWHRMVQDDLLRYVRAVRSRVTQPVTTADDYNFWNKPEAARVADEVDFIVTHIYPLWNGKTLKNAIGWMDSTINDIQGRYLGKQIVIGETGWATRYNPAKKGDGEQGTLIKGKVGYAAQEKYLILHNEWVNAKGITTFLFEAFDEPWKGGGASSGLEEIEKNWGVFYADRTPKVSFQNYLKHKNNDVNQTR
jgi:exo-beta-1,3-glucanase (GH17 family)